MHLAIWIEGRRADTTRIVVIAMESLEGEGGKELMERSVLQAIFKHKLLMQS